MVVTKPGDTKTKKRQLLFCVSTVGENNQAPEKSTYKIYTGKIAALHQTVDQWIFWNAGEYLSSIAYVCESMLSLSKRHLVLLELRVRNQFALRDDLEEPG